MTGDKYLLDTNIIVEIFGGNKEMADKVHNLPVFYVPSVVLGELYTGINRVTNRAKHLKSLRDFLNLCILLNVDRVTAQHYGEIVATLHKKGRPIPLNDVWISAVALQHGLTIASNDKHFREIAGLKVENW